MNLKYAGIISAMALSVAFAQESAPVAEAPANGVAAEAAAQTAAAENIAINAALAEAAAPTETTADPAETTVESTVETAPVENTQAPVAEIAPAAEPTPVADVAVAPKAVRGEADADDAFAPKTVRGADNAPQTIYYETVYTREDGVPVRTVYVAQRSANDSTDLDKLMGLIPMTFKVGVQGSIGSYYMTGDKWDSDQYDGLSWRAGLTTLIPLNEYTMGIKLGVLFEKSEAGETYSYVDRDSKESVPVSFTFKQMKIDLPVLFTFKGASSRFFFDMGAQISIPIKDQLKISYNDGKQSVKEKIDLMDDEYRAPLDWNLVFGFSVLAIKNLSIDVRADLGLSDLYDKNDNFPNLDLSTSAFTLGVTFYPF